MSIRAWWANKLAQAQASAENKQRIEASSTAKIVAENDLAIRTAVKKAEELGIDNDTVKQHLHVNWWDDAPAPVSLDDFIAKLSDEQKAQLKAKLG